jgi:hypothetical protein
MHPPVLDAVRRAPLAWPFLGACRRLAAGSEGFPTVDAIDRALGPMGGVRFEPATPRPRGGRRRAPKEAAEATSGYDASIVERGVVPTRPGSTHDLANALVWATFPRSKRALHARQLAAVRAAPPGRRTEEGDLLAMLDEGGVVLATARGAIDAVRAALRGARTDALRDLRAAGHTLGIVFGHSIVEHLATDRDVTPSGRAIGGLAVPLEVDDPTTAPLVAIDALLAERIGDRGCLARRGEQGIAPVEASVLGWRG